MKLNNLILGLFLLLLAACANENNSSVAVCDIYGANGGAIPADVAGGLRIHDASIVEGDTGSKQMTFWVSLDAPYPADVTFDYVSSDGNAEAGADYEAVSGSGVILAGSLGTSFTVTIFGDTDAHLVGNENNEYFLVTLSNVSSNVTEIGLPYAAGIIENDEGFTKYQAAVITVAPDYSSGAHSLVSVVNGGLAAVNNIAASFSDMGIASYGEKLFRIERGTGANLVKFDRNCSLAKEAWIYGARDLGDTALNTNPQHLIVLNPSKAYLTRYGQPSVWVVNPSATRPEQFKIGELDLSAYADADTSPEAHNGVIVEGKLFLTMQRIDFTPGWPNNVAGTAYVAVFDTETDIEIDATGTGAAMKGIPLTILNPNNDIIYNSFDHRIYVQGSGGFDGTKTGGVEKIDPDVYTASVVIQDSDLAYSHGESIGIAIVSASQGYLLGSAAWGDHSLYKFDLSTGDVTGPVTGYASKQLADISLDAANQLWISEAGTDATLHLLDTADDTTIDSVSTNFNPGQVVFFSP